MGSEMCIRDSQSVACLQESTEQPPTLVEKGDTGGTTMRTMSGIIPGEEWAHEEARDREEMVDIFDHELFQ